MVIKYWLALFAVMFGYPALIWFFPVEFLWSLVPTTVAVGFTTVYQHRYANHRAMSMGPRTRASFETVGYLVTPANTHLWVCAHRNHHAHSDNEHDTHSPHWVTLSDGTKRRTHKWYEGLVPFILVANVFEWAAWLRENRHQVTLRAKDVLAERNWWTRQLYKAPYLGVAIGTGVLMLILGPIGGMAAALMHTFSYVFILNPLINGLGHYPHPWLGGYQHNRRAKDTWNNWVVALLTGGEGFHHNHHWEQVSARLAKYWWEVPADWGYWAVILPLQGLGLVWDVRHPKNFTRDIAPLA